MAEQSLKVATWNIRDGLSGGQDTSPEDMQAVVERIKTLEADIITLPEGFHADARTGDDQKAEILADASSRLLDAGYDAHRVLYNDADGRKDRHGFALLTRLRGTENAVRAIELGSRTVLGQHIGALALDIVGVHLDDRRELTRMEQTKALLAQLDAENHNVVMGDFNAMHRTDSKARILRLMRPFARALPVVDPGETAPNLAKLRRVGSLSSRLTDMANGSTMNRFRAADYIDVDEQHQPTRGPVQLDHILTNFHSKNNAAAYLDIGDYQVHEVTSVESDHRPVSAVIEY